MRKKFFLQEECKVSFFINILATLRLSFDFAQDRLFSVTVMLSPLTLLRIHSVEAYAI